MNEANFQYFVSYQFTDNKVAGFGMAELVLRKPVTEMENINEMAKYIQEKYDFQGVIILNYQLLKKG